MLLPLVRLTVRSQGQLDHTLTTSQIPSHFHFAFAATNASATTQSNLTSSTQAARGSGFSGGSIDEKYSIMATGTGASVGRTSSTGSGSGHTHTPDHSQCTSTFTGSSKRIGREICGRNYRNQRLTERATYADRSETELSFGQVQTLQTIRLCTLYEDCR